MIYDFKEIRRWMWILKAAFSLGDVAHTLRTILENT